MRLLISKLSICLIVLFTSNLNAQTISPQLVGTNVWYINPSDQVWKLTEECGVKTIRIGGHAYDKNLPDNETLLDWVSKIQAMGAEPVLQVSQYQPPKAAADLVRLFNVEKRNGISPIKNWHIGNEPWLQAGRPPHSEMGALVEKYFKPIAAAMKEVDPTIKIYGPNFCDFLDEPINDLFGGKNDITVKVPGKDYYYCDGLMWHRYPQGDGDPAVEGANDFHGRIVKAKAKIDEVNAQHKRTGDNALVWGIGEYNSKGGPEVHTWGNGQMFGAVLGWCMEYGAKYATSWSMFEHGGDRKGSDFSLIDGANMTPRASYRHMQFVANYFKGEFVKGTVSDDDFMVYGAQEGDQLSVMIMNRGFGESKEYNLLLKDTKQKKQGVNLVVFGNRDVEYRDMIDPRSTQVLVFNQDSVTIIKYTSDDFDNERPPVTIRSSLKPRVQPRKSIQSRQSSLDTKFIDLGPYYNFSLSEEIHDKPQNVIPIPVGLHDYNGIQFDVRGIIQLDSRLAYPSSHIHYPKEIKGIPINHSAKQLCLLHSSAWASEQGADVAEIVVHYANNQTQSFKIKYQLDVEDWWFHQQNSTFPPNAKQAWEGVNDRVKDLGFVLKLYSYKWNNPFPDVEIKSVDLVSSGNNTGYMLYGITCF